MISFGSIKMGDASNKSRDGGTKLEPGQIGVESYINEIRERNTAVPNADGIIASIEEELNNIAGTINRTIEMIEQDPQIQYCVTGRNLEQITGKQGEMTTGRFPNLLNQVKMQIAVAALRQAQDNYNAKLNEEISVATKNASVDIAEYMCHKVAQNQGEMFDAISTSTPLVAPYAISYEIASGIDNSELTKGGFGQTTFQSDNGSGMIKETSSLFNRETRICHVCTTTTTQSCTVKGGNWFRKKNTSCTTTTSDPYCEDIAM